MRISKLLTAAALISAFAAPALAQPPAQTPEQQAAAFKAADKNGDGKLDFAEWKASLGERAAQASDDMLKQFFERRDTNKDGFIDAAENAAPMGRRGG
jgi:Ca2+-binding EF-hand superfamily protein